MNIINKILLALALSASALYKRMGVNSRQLEAILRTKLMIDDRRPNSFQQVQQKNNKPVNAATLATMFLAALMGCIFLTSFMFGKNDETRLTLYFSFYVVVLSIMLIADFTHVLIDIRDNFIILPKPVTDNTFVLSRLLHIFIHVCKLVLPMILPALIYLMIKKGLWSFPPFLFIVLMATLFTIFVINASYIIILKITTPARFQTIISYIQIFFAVFFYAAMQLVPRLLNKVALEEYDINQHSGFVFLPTYWFAGAWRQLYAWDNTLRLWLCLVFSVIVPLLSVWLVIRYFAPSFNRKLSMISGAVSEVQATGNKKNMNKAGPSAYSSALAKLFTRKGTEHAGFVFTWKMMLRSRDFKMKVYPSIGYIIVLIFVMAFTNRTTSFADIASQTRNGVITSLMIIYFCSLVTISAVAQITMHDKFKAGWIFFTTPLARPGGLISGAIKAAVAQFFSPIAFIIILFLVLVAGPSILPNALFGIANQLVITALTAYISINKLPFTSPVQVDKGSSVLRVFAVMFISVVLAITHFFLYKMTIVVIILSIISLTAAWFILDAIHRLSWNKVKSMYRD